MVASSPRSSVFLTARLCLCGLVVAAALTFTACTKTPPPVAAKILRLGNGAEPEELDPHRVSGVSEHRILMALFEGLVTESATGEGVAPGVAERWEHSPDRLTWTFHLRPTAQWSDGTPVTAHDFIAAYRRILSPSLGAEYAYKLYPVVGAQDFHQGRLSDFAQTGFSAPAAHTLILRLKHPVPYLLEALKHYAWYPVPLATIARHGPVDRPGNRWTRPENFVGNGPFVLSEWLPDQHLRVTRSASYRGATTPALDAIFFYPVNNEQTEERLFRSGQLDVTYTLPADLVATYREKHPDVLRIAPYYGTYFYRLNLTRPPLDDVRLRRALALAIDRDALVESILRAGEEPAFHFTPEAFGFTPDETLSHDPDAARRLLVEAGYPGGRGLRRIELLYNTTEAHKRIAEVLQQMWKTELGIETVLRNEEWQVYLQSQRRLDYDVARSGWIADYPDPQTFLDLWISGGGNNDTGYANPDYDRLLASALAAPNESARMEIYRQLENRLVRDVPIIPLYFYKRGYLVAPQVKNWRPHLLDNRAWQHLDLAP